MESVQPLRSYRAAYVPKGIEREDVETHATAGTLPMIRVKARDCQHAQWAAHQVTGRPVHSAERVDEVAP
jgi:hypothetical protein